MSENPPISRSDVLLLVVPVGLAMTTYQLWLHPKAFEEIEPVPLLFLFIAFWLTVATTCIAMPLFRTHPKLTAGCLCISVLSFAFTSNPVLTMSLWLLEGKLWWVEP